MTVPPSLLEVPTVVTTHQNADFDALAATVGAALLYPEARIVFGGSLNPNVREFVSLHGENLPIMSLRLIDQSKIRRLVIVDTAHPQRIGDLGHLCAREGVETVVFDHHEAEGPERPSFVRGEDWVLSGDGAQATSLLHILRERDVEISGSRPPSSRLVSMKTPVRSPIRAPPSAMRRCSPSRCALAPLKP